MLGGETLENQKKDAPNYCEYFMENRTDKTLKVIWTGDIEDEPIVCMMEPKIGWHCRPKSTDMGWGGKDSAFRYHVWKINNDSTELDCGVHKIKISTSVLSLCNGSYFGIYLKQSGFDTIEVKSRGSVGGNDRTEFDVVLKSIYLGDWIK
jgi:hypothetical protein